jgi:predicted Zn-dependent protease
MSRESIHHRKFQHQPASYANFLTCVWRQSIYPKLLNSFPIRYQRLKFIISGAFCTGLITILAHVSLATNFPHPLAQPSPEFFTQSITQFTELPPLQVHPLPTSLVQWQDTKNTGDYFSQVKPTSAGFLVWSEFPVKIYVERLAATSPQSSNISASARRFQQWTDHVIQAIQEWSVYLPLEVVEQREKADIIILRSLPPLRPSFNRDTREIQLPNARAAETRYHFYLRQTAESATVLTHRFTILLSPDLSTANILAAARHELGHALGIWGHSPLETDAMYFSQVRNPPPISTRDINTLKRIYQQPTRLGWQFADRVGNG